MTYCELKQFFYLFFCMCTYSVKCGYVRKTSLVILFDICPIFYLFLSLFILLPSMDITQNVKETKILCPNDDDDDVDDHFSLSFLALLYFPWPFSVQFITIFNESWGLRDILTVSLSLSIEIYFNYSTLAFETLIEDYVVLLLIIWDSMDTLLRT